MVKNKNKPNREFILAQSKQIDNELKGKTPIELINNMAHEGIKTREQIAKTLNVDVGAVVSWVRYHGMKFDESVGKYTLKEGIQMAETKKTTTKKAEVENKKVPTGMTVRLSDDIDKALNLQAMREKTSKAKIIEKALEQYISDDLKEMAKSI